MMNRCGKLIVISGPSGVGKGTLIHSFLEGCPNLAVSISATTRAPREGEENGVHYYFITKEDFEERIETGRMLEYACYNGNYYGTPKDMVECACKEGKDIILEIEVQGAQQIKMLCPDAVLIFIMPPSLEVLQKRLTDRHTEDDTAIQNRLHIATEELSHADEYDYIVINDVLDRARNELLEILCKLREQA